MSDILKEVAMFKVPWAYFADPETTASFERLPDWRTARTAARDEFLSQGMDEATAGYMANAKMLVRFMSLVRRDIIIELADLYRETPIEDWTPEIDRRAEFMADETVYRALGELNRAFMEVTE